jgi:hypothetical protein
MKTEKGNIWDGKASTLTFADSGNVVKCVSINTLGSKVYYPELEHVDTILTPLAGGAIVTHILWSPLGRDHQFFFAGGGAILPHEMK